MKISLSKMPFLNKLPPELRGKPFKSFLIIAFLIAAFTYLIFTGSRETNTIRKSIKPSTVKKSAKETNDKDVGVLTGTLDTKAYISRIEKQYYDISNKFDLLNSRIVTLEKSTQDLRKNESDVGKIVMDFDNRIAEKIGGGSTLSKLKETRGQGAGTTEEAFDVSRSVPQASSKSLNLEMAKVGEIRTEDNPKEKERYTYLPLGSFVKCTLLTGVFAPTNESNPLPVLISVDEAFYGPNNTRIPLKGAFAIGKAIGDVVSKRAIIQIVSLSMALPDGKVFEHEGNLGYLADEDGHLGIEGTVIYNTGRQLGLNFLSGFLAGGAEALSQAETSTVTGAYGQTSRNVTGDTGRYAMFSGLANSAQGMSNYYQKQLGTMIPAVKIEAGKKVVFVVQKGVQIEGLESNANNFDYIDN